MGHDGLDAGPPGGATAGSEEQDQPEKAGSGKNGVSAKPLEFQVQSARV